MHSDSVEVRIYTPSDAKALVNIFYNTIHKVNIQDYTLEQVNAWAPKSFLILDHWTEKWKKLKPFVGVINTTIVGFAELEDNGHIDCFYVHHEFQRCGVGAALMGAIYRNAAEKNIIKINADVSITAKPFFEHHGFRVITEQLVEKRGVKFKNYKMEVNLEKQNFLAEK